MENEKDKTIRTLENLIQQGFLGVKGHYAFIYIKVQKLVAACYLITDLMKDGEPLKWQIRDTGLSLLSDNLSLIRASSADRKVIFSVVSGLSVELISFIEIAYIAGLVSPMNFSLLQKEFGDLIGLIQERENPKALESSFVLSKQFLDVDESLYKESPDKGQHNNVLNNMSFRKESPIESQSHQKAPLQRNIQKDTTSTSKKNSRQDLIIAHLKKIGGEISVKEFVGIIPGCGEKTIQRELLSLVAKGVLKKVGERRWSKYSLR